MCFGGVFLGGVIFLGMEYNFNAIIIPAEVGVFDI